MEAAPSTATAGTDLVDYQTHPERYAHWRLQFDAPVATLVRTHPLRSGRRDAMRKRLQTP